MAELPEAIVFFDGVCNLCNGAVQFILKRERNSKLKFATLQGETFAQLSSKPDATMGESILLLQDNILYRESTAVLRISRYLKLPWRTLGYLGEIFPKNFAGKIYRFIARNRYRWFGKQDTCYLPTPALKARFLS